MTAVTFAEHGEHESALNFLERQPGKKKVLLGIEENEFNPNLLRRALHLCRRVGAKLEILHFLKTEEQGPAAARQPRSRSMGSGIEYTVITGAGALEEKLAFRARETRDIILIALAPPGSRTPKKGRRDKAPREMLAKTNCPVVVLSEPVKN